MVGEGKGHGGHSSLEFMMGSKALEGDGIVLENAPHPPRPP